jgi:hypothetical protein
MIEEDKKAKYMRSHCPDQSQATKPPFRCMRAVDHRQQVGGADRAEIAEIPLQA